MPVPKGERYGGRKKGTPNKVTADIKALAQEYGKEAIEGLVHLGRNAESEQAQAAAWRELLDRGYGKAKQSVDSKVEHSVSDELAKLLSEYDDTVPAPKAGDEPEEP